MAKRNSRRLRNRSRSRRMAMAMAGGSNYSDAASYGMYVNGTGADQWSRTMDQTGAYGKIQGNVLIGAQGQNVSPVSQMPTAANLQLVQSAGRRRKRGGFLGEVVNQALVPATILGMQQTYRRNKSAGRRRKRGGFLGEVVNQALVPVSILGMQQTYRRNKRAGRRTRRR